MAEIASGSIDLKSLKIAGEPNKYVTMIDGSGIRVHETGAVNTNFAQINSNGMQIYKGGDKVAEFGSTSTIGIEEESHVQISDTAVSIWNDDTCAVSLEGGTTPYITYGHINFIPNDLDMGICEITGDWAPIWGDGDTTIGEVVSTTMIARADSGNDASITLTSVDSSDADIGTYASVTINPSLTINDHSSPIGTIQSNSANVAITTANINTYSIGPSLTLTPGTYIIRGVAQFNTTSSPTSPRITDIDLATDNNTSSTASPLSRVRVCHGTGYWARLEATAPVVITEDTTVYVKISASVTSTAQACVINALRIV